MNWKVQIVAALILLSAGFFIGTQYSQESKTEVVEKEVIKRDVITIVKEVKRPDGTIERSETTHDKSKERVTKRDTVLVSVPLPLNRLGISMQTSNFREPHSYTLSYERRLLGSVWLGVNYNTKNVYGLSAALEF